MSQLLDLQRRVAAAVMQPLTSAETMRHRTADGRSMHAEAAALIKPNNRLTSFERLEIYNRQYWFRVLSCFAEDFPGLRAIVGPRPFQQLSRAYLVDCPSVSFTLRNLGSQLESWLRRNPHWIETSPQLALDMVRLEWAHVEAFDGLLAPPLTLTDVEKAEDGLSFELQPYLRLLQLNFAVDDLLIEVRRYQGDSSTASNSAHTGQLRRRVRRYSLPEPEPVYLAVHRFEDSVYYKRLEPEAFLMLEGLGARQPLEEALQQAFAESKLSETDRLAALQQWFAHWAELGWFCSNA
jgi:hypothetical protein